MRAGVDVCVYLCARTLDGVALNVLVCSGLVSKELIMLIQR